jgi:hypothetical protein
MAILTLLGTFAHTQFIVHVIKKTTHREDGGVHSNVEREKHVTSNARDAEGRPMARLQQRILVSRKDCEVQQVQEGRVDFRYESHAHVGHQHLFLQRNKYKYCVYHT